MVKKIDHNLESLMSGTSSLPFLGRIFALSVVLMAFAELTFYVRAILWLQATVSLLGGVSITVLFYKLLYPYMQEAIHLRKENARLRRLCVRRDEVIQHLHNGVLIVDGKGRILEANPAIHRMLDYAEGALKGMHVELLVPVDLRECHREHMRAFFQVPHVRPMHRMPDGLPIACADGSVLIVDIMLIPLSHEDKEVALVVRDLSEERALRQALKQKVEQYQALSRLTRAYAFGVMLRGEEITKLWVTPTVREVLGVEPEEWMHMPAIEGEFVPEEERERLKYVLEQLREPGEAWAERTYEDVFRIWTREKREVMLRLFMRAEKRGNHVYVMGAAQDITEEYHRQMALQEALQVQEVLLNNMSHEVRTPLTGIIGFANILKEELQGDQREFATLIETSGERLLTLLTSLLHLAQMRSNRFQLKQEVLNVAEVVQQYVVEDTPEVAVQLEGPSHLSVQMDPNVLHEMIRHLLNNAYKFTSEGSIRVFWQQEGEGNLRLQVADTGVGIHPDFIPRLFNPFTQESTGDQRAYEGAGLGLALVRELVDLYGGDITVESEPEKGSTFTIWIPGVVTTPVQTDVEEKRKPCTSCPRILVVDDNPTICRLIEKGLGEAYRVEIAHDVRAALDCLRRDDYRLVLLDIHLGHAHPQGGLSLLHTIRSDARLKHTPVVALTAYADGRARTRFLDEGFDVYIEKPFSVRQLKERVNTILHGQRKQAV